MTISYHLGKITNYNCQCGKTLANKNIEEELMKKFLKFGAVLTALVLSLVCFMACGEEEESRSVEAEYQEVDNNPWVYTFYTDGTYEFKEYQQITEKGNYYGSPTKEE